MSLQLDHVVIAVQDLDTAVQDYRDLGFTVVRGGIHTNRATHNALIIFADGTYLELLAATGEPPIPGLIDFSVLLQHGEGLAGFALRSGNLDADVVQLRVDGFAVGEAIPGERHRADGTVIRWKLALIDDHFAPFLIQDVTPRVWRIPTDPAFTTHANRAVGLSGIEMTVRAIEPAWERYTRLFGSVTPPPSRTDRTTQSVVLSEMAEAEATEALDAVLLVFERPGDGRFTLEKTHGVRFQQIVAGHA